MCSLSEEEQGTYEITVLWVSVVRQVMRALLTGKWEKKAGNVLTKVIICAMESKK